MTKAAIALQQTIRSTESASASPNKKFTAAIIGCEIRSSGSWQDWRTAMWPGSATLNSFAQTLWVELKRPMPRKAQDLRQVLEDKDVDMLFIATPNHWHALAAIWAMPAGNLTEAGIDLDKTRLTLRRHLLIDGNKQAFLDNAAANARLTRESRAPFVVPKPGKI